MVILDEIVSTDSKKLRVPESYCREVVNRIPISHILRRMMNCLPVCLSMLIIRSSTGSWGVGVLTWEARGAYLVLQVQVYSGSVGCIIRLFFLFCYLERPITSIWQVCDALFKLSSNQSQLTKLSQRRHRAVLWSRACKPLAWANTYSLISLLGQKLG